jgi:SNF2 family DNA or RNA helicase
MQGLGKTVQTIAFLAALLSPQLTPQEDPDVGGVLDLEQ